MNRASFWRVLFYVIRASHNCAFTLNKRLSDARLWAYHKAWPQR